MKLPEKEKEFRLDGKKKKATIRRRFQRKREVEKI